MEEIGSTSYQYVSEEKVPELLICGICTCPCVKPLRTPCNHYFCSSCLNQYFQYPPNNNNNNNNYNNNNNEGEKKKSCLICRKEISLSRTVEETHPLILLQLTSLQIYCTKKENGCEWKGPRSNLQDHSQLSCSSIECLNKNRGCEWKGTLINRELHYVKECEFVEVFCKYRKTVQCEFSTERKFISSHELNCQKYLDHKKRMENEKRKQQETKERKRIEKFQKKLKERKEEVLSNRGIRINVSGTLFTTSLKTLCADQSSLLYSIYIDYKENRRGGREEEIFLDCDAKSFSHILFWLRSGELPMDLKEKEIQCIRITSSYLNLTSLLSYLPSYFPSLPSSQSQKFMEISSKLSKNQNTSSSLSFSPSLVIPDQFYNLLSDIHDKDNKSDMEDKENRIENIQNIYSNNKENSQINRYNEANLLNNEYLKEINRIKITSDQLKIVSQNKSNLDMRRRDFSREKAVGLQLTNALFNESLFKDCSLTYCNFTSSDFNKSNFENAILKLSNFMNCNLSDCNFQNANLSNSNISSDLSNSILSHAKLSNSNLLNSDLSNTNFTDGDLSNANLSNCNISGTNFKGANLIGSLFRNSILKSTIFNNTNLSNIDFSNCDLSSMKFISCDLTSCNFTNSNLTAAEFTGSKIDDANFCKAIITNAEFTNTTGYPMPTNYYSHPIGIPRKVGSTRCSQCHSAIGNSIIIGSFNALIDNLFNRSSSRRNDGEAAFQYICSRCNVY